MRSIEPTPTGRDSAEGRVFRVALTGGIGSGKSTVASLFAALGVQVIDADAVAHALTAPGQPTVMEIGRAFGPGLVDDAGALDRAALRRIVFADATQRRRLEALLHPRIRDRIMADLDREFPNYGFAKHQGYGTAQHLQALRLHGPCRHHRRSFQPTAQLTLPFG